MKYIAATLPDEGQTWWSVNPLMEYVTVFREFKRRYKRRSTKIMNAVYMVYDPKSELKSSGLTEEEIKREVAVNYLKDENFPWEDHMELIEAYIAYCKTKVEKQLDNWYMELQLRDAYINGLSWDQNSTEKDKMMLNTDKHYEAYFKIEAQLKAERSAAESYGDYERSLSESF